MMIPAEHKDFLKASIMKRLYTTSVVLFFSFLSSVFSSCSKDPATKMYSTEHLVRCFFNVPQYTQLFNTLGSFGEFATIRVQKGQGIIKMSSNIGSTDYPILADMRGFQFGLGGIIVGTNYYGEYLAFDLACPNCNRADRRLTIGDAGIAKCTKCGISYDLNNYGVISAVTSTILYDAPRGLFRYRILYDGTNLSVYN